jgi:hypothetical protein
MPPSPQESCSGFVVDFVVGFIGFLFSLRSGKSRKNSVQDLLKYFALPILEILPFSC